MAIKKLQINIKINTDCDSLDDVKELIFALMREAGDRTFAIDSVMIDGVENFSIEKGFMDDLAKNWQLWRNERCMAMRENHGYR